MTALLRRGMANDPAARPTAAELRDRLFELRLVSPVRSLPAMQLSAPPAVPRQAAAELGAEQTQPAPIGCAAEQTQLTPVSWFGTRTVPLN